MAWVVLVLAGVLEAVWAVALSSFNRFAGAGAVRRLGVAALFAVALVLSMVGLAYAMTQLPTGTAYAVWVGIGATLTVLWGIVTGEERATAARSLLLMGLVGSVVGLKVVS